MHKIYKDRGNFNFLYLLPQIIYSTILSETIERLIKYLGSSKENIIEFKQEKNKIIFLSIQFI